MDTQEKPLVELHKFLEQWGYDLSIVIVSPSGRSVVTLDEALQDAFKGWQIVPRPVPRNSNGQGLDNAGID